MCCVLGQNALLSQRLSAPRSRNENLMKCQGSNFGMDWLPIQGGGTYTLSHFIGQKLG